MNLDDVAKLLTTQFVDRYNFVNKATLELLREEIVYLPYELHAKEEVHVDWKKYSVAELKEFTELNIGNF